MKISKYIIILLAMLAPLFSGCITEDILRSNNNVFEIQINNTNLAPTVAGEPAGTGERIQNITYYANNSPIELFVVAHAASSGQDAELHLFINGTKVADTSGKPLGVAEQQNKTIVAIVPRYASYMIQANNYHHYEWREYTVVSGESTSPTIAQGSDTLKVNKSGDTISGYLSFSENKGIAVTANSSVGGIQRLILFKMTTPYDRPWMTWLDENGRNKISMGYHTLNAADNATHEDFEMKSSNETGGDMITRFALGTNKLLVNATFTDIDTFFVRSTSSTIFQMITQTATINIGNGTNTLSKIDFSGSRGQIGYSGSGMIIQSGASKPMEFHVNNSGSPGAASRAISIDVNRSVQLPAYSGTGTRAVCFDASGNIIASTNSTSNYLTC